MTSDAKIGLLLGLVFIFIIAFIINGLPSFHSDTNNNELTTNMVSSQDNSLGLAEKERKAQETLNRPEPSQSLAEVQIPPSNNQDSSAVAALPQSPSETEVEANETGLVAASGLSSEEISGVSQDKSLSPKVYVVSQGDSLASIAKKFYGPREGNKKANINMIFTANRKLLKSPHEIHIGQKLIIPPPAKSSQHSGKIANVSSSTTLKKVKPAGEGQISNDTAAAKAVQSKEYVVKEGDSLWKIAVEQLENGCRYTEIAELNSDILADENTLSVGMCLKIPPK